MENIELSICIPTYKGGEMLKICVEEILSYEGREIEVVVSDNASDDGSIEALREIKDDRLKIYVNESNCGPFRNWYKALQRGNGRYLMLLYDNDHLIVENLPAYLDLLRGTDYDVIRNAYANRERIAGPVTCAHWLFYAYIFSHASMVAYRKKAFDSFKPLEKSFEVEFCSYPYYIWDIQILCQKPIHMKACYINGDIEIMRIGKLTDKKPSRTIVVLEGKNIPAPFTFDNAVYYFDKYTDYLRTVYTNDKDVNYWYCNLYRGLLFMGTLFFYEHMNNPQSRERYGVYVKNEEDIDYIQLNDVFYAHAKELAKTWCKARSLNLRLYLITCQNRLLFKLNHVYERNFKNPRYFCGCVINRFLSKLICIIIS